MEITNFYDTIFYKTVRQNAKERAERFLKRNNLAVTRLTRSGVSYATVSKFLNTDKPVQMKVIHKITEYILSEEEKEICWQK